MTKETIIETIKRKLSSRKLWMSIASFVSLLMVAIGQPEANATQVSALIMAGASVVGYVIAEGLADSAGAGAAGGETSTDDTTNDTKTE